MTGSLPSPRAAVALMEGYHSPQLDVAVRLNTNESPVPPPAEWSHRLADATRELTVHRYPDRAATKLREAIAAHHGVAPAAVFVANGSNEVLQTVCLTYGGAERTALTYEPTYALHSHIARISGTRVVSRDRTSDFEIDEGEFFATLDDVRPDLAFLCSPNNPTGRIESRSFIERAVAAVPGLLIVDEAYGQFAPWSAMELLGDEVPLVVVRTFSKTWSMAGIRLGYLLGPPAVIEALDKVVLPYHLDSIKQTAGVLALEYDAEMRERVTMLVNERERVVAGLAKLAVTTWPSGANFILFRPATADGNDVWQGLVDHGVLVRNCSSWPRLDGCLRVTIGTPAENDAFLDALSEVLP